MEQSKEKIYNRIKIRLTVIDIVIDLVLLIALAFSGLADLFAGYALGKYAVRLKVSNLANTLSYNVHDDNSVNPIAPRQFSASVSYKF